VKQTKKAFSKQGNPAGKANWLLACIRSHRAAVERGEARFNKAVEALRKQYDGQYNMNREALAIAEQSLIALMKKERGYLFVGGDILKLENGSLIFNTKDKVSIPKDALEECRARFPDVIKIVESLDRDAIEKWPDAKLLLIGASRKTKEVFGYELKKVKS
jgi:hypothetical protein